MTRTEINGSTQPGLGGTAGDLNQKILRTARKMKYTSRIIVAALVFISPHSNAEIFAESGPERGKNSVLLLTTPCKGDAGRAGYKMATMRVNDLIIDGCYIENNSQNFVIKWTDGNIDKLPRSSLIFRAKNASEKDAPPEKTRNFETHSCDYQNISKNIVLSGPCHKQETYFSGNFGYILTWPSGNKISIEYIKSQSGNHIWKINGKSAVAVEMNREHLRGFTTDLNQFLEWQDRPQ